MSRDHAKTLDLAGGDRAISDRRSLHHCPWQPHRGRRRHRDHHAGGRRRPRRIACLCALRRDGGRGGRAYRGDAGRIAAGCTREDLAAAMPAGAARNALDCALWDLEAKRAGVPAHVFAGLDRIALATTCFTISLGTPDVIDGRRPRRAAGDDPEDQARCRRRVTRRASPRCALRARRGACRRCRRGWSEAALPACCRPAGRRGRPGGAALAAKPSAILAGLRGIVPICRRRKRPRRRRSRRSRRSL